jgi:aryl-alcohol dehydrogenase-like predicted oxidoreductase
MKTSPFGKTGFHVSNLGFGAAPAAFLKSDQDRTATFIESMLDQGMNLIDTAAMYDGSEEFLGNRLSHRRGDFFLVTKCGHKLKDSPDAPTTPFSADLVTYSIDRALRLLKTDRIDCMLLHSCDLKTLQQGDAVAALIQARDAGKIRFCGYSGDNEAAQYAATLPDIAIIETSINIVDQANIDKVLPTTRKQNIGVIAKRPVANACWKPLEAQPGLYRNYAKVYTERFAKMGIAPGDFGAQDDPELFLRFTLSQPGVHCAIVGTTDPNNAAKNIEFASRPSLDESIVNKLRDSFKKADPRGEWTGQT